MSSFLTRIISATIYATIFIFCIIFSQKSYIGLIIFFGSICIWEFSRIINVRSVLLHILVLLVIIPLTYYKKIQLDNTWILLLICLFHSVFLILDLYSRKFFNRNVVNKFLLTFNYIVLSFFFLAFLPFINDVYTPYLIIFVILIIWANDSFAYLVGKKFGKHKLFERISPKKTIEGFIGGFVFSLITAVLIGKYSELFISTSSELFIFTNLDWVIIALIISVIGSYGDLVESKFKRQANVKDSGTIMPGHGGLLDRLDNLFFIAPFVYLYINYVLL